MVVVVVVSEAAVDAYQTKENTPAAWLSRVYYATTAQLKCRRANFKDLKTAQSVECAGGCWPLLGLHGQNTKGVTSAHWL